MEKIDIHPGHWTQSTEGTDVFVERSPDEDFLVSISDLKKDVEALKAWIDTEFPRKVEKEGPDVEEIGALLKYINIKLKRKVDEIFDLGGSE